MLLKQRVSDVLMDLRAERVFSAHWTENIDTEFLRNMQEVYQVSETRAQNRLRAMKARCPEWEVHMSTAAFSAVPGQVDAKDRHVAAPAIALRQAVDEDIEDDEPGQTYDFILVTDNVKDLAKKQMAGLGIRVIRPGSNIVEQDHRAVKRIVRPMLGFKSFRCARALIAGIETMHMIRKGQMYCRESQASSAAAQFYSLAF